MTPALGLDSLVVMPRKRKFVVYVATSADGFIARKNGAVDWLDRPRSKGNYGMDAFYRSIDTCVMGRKTYDLSVTFGMREGYAGKKKLHLFEEAEEGRQLKNARSE
jgi:dihydrofolate reductase